MRALLLAALMPLYLCDVVVVNDRDDGLVRRPPMVGPLADGWLPGWLDLGSHGVIEMPAFSDSRFRLIADDVSMRVSAQAESVINGELGVALSGRAPMDELLRSLLEDQADGVRWKTLRRGVRHTEIYLAGRVVYRRAEPLLAHSQDFTETWSGGDGSTLTQAAGRQFNWTEVNNDTTVVSSLIEPVSTAGAVCSVRCDQALDTDNHRASAPYALFTGGSGQRVGITARMDTNAYASRNHYHTLARYNPSPNHNRQLRRVVAGAATALVNDSTAPDASGTIYCECNGSTITGQIGSLTLGPVTDTNITGNVRCGTDEHFQNGGTGRATMGAFHFYDLVAAVTPKALAALGVG